MVDPVQIINRVFTEIPTFPIARLYSMLMHFFEILSNFCLILDFKGPFVYSSDSQDTF